jgi:hypothetical protein
VAVRSWLENLTDSAARAAFWQQIAIQVEIQQLIN